MSHPQSRFRVDGPTFVVPARCRVLPGDVVEGVVKPGMLINIPDLPVPLRIIGTELISRTDLPAQVGLTFAYSSEEEASVWEALDLDKCVLDVMKGDA